MASQLNRQPPSSANYGPKLWSLSLETAASGRPTTQVRAFFAMMADGNCACTIRRLSGWPFSWANARAFRGSFEFGGSITLCPLFGLQAAPIDRFGPALGELANLATVSRKWRCWERAANGWLDGRLICISQAERNQ